MKENTNLKSQLEDTKTTLVINKDLLFKYISQKTKSGEEKQTGKETNMNFFTELQSENSRLAESIHKLFNEKIVIEKKVKIVKTYFKLYKTQQELEDRIIQDRESLDKMSEKLLVLDNKLQEREYIVSHLKVELDKYYQNDLISTKEILLADPDRTNLELYNELNYSREIVAKVSRMLNAEKTKSTMQDNKIIELEEKITNFKKGIKISKNMDKISILDYISSSEDGDGEEDDDDDKLFNIDSPLAHFPEKIKNSKVSQNKSFSCGLNIPKLDLSVVKAKYHHPKNIEIAEVINNKETNRSSNEYIEKLKFQLKICKNTIRVMKKKLEKFKRIFQVQKTTIVSMKNKNELLELQLKKSTCSTYDELSNNKKDVNNTSMNLNMSIHYTEVEEDDNDEDFNYVIREYNKSVVNTAY